MGIMKDYKFNQYLDYKNCMADSDLHFSSRLSFFCEYLIILAQRGKNRSGD